MMYLSSTKNNQNSTNSQQSLQNGCNYFPIEIENILVLSKRSQKTSAKSNAKEIEKNIQITLEREKSMIFHHAFENEKLGSLSTSRKQVIRNNSNYQTSVFSVSMKCKFGVFPLFEGLSDRFPLAIMFNRVHLKDYK